jgi:hypothetical protein
MPGVRSAGKPRWARTTQWLDFPAVGWHPVADIVRHRSLPTVSITPTISPTTKWLNSPHHDRSFPPGQSGLRTCQQHERGGPPPQSFAIRVSLLFNPFRVDRIFPCLVPRVGASTPLPSATESNRIRGSANSTALNHAATFNDGLGSGRAWLDRKKAQARLAHSKGEKLFPSHSKDTVIARGGGAA